MRANCYRKWLKKYYRYLTPFPNFILSNQQSFMLFNKVLRFCFCLVFIFICPVVYSQTADKKASTETKKLHKKLKKLLNKGIMFGHQDALAYGVGWKYEEGKSDVKDVTGQLPAVFGWDVAGLEKESRVNIDSVPFDKMREYIKQVYDKGLINTISWHLDNPYTGKTAWDETAGSVASILPDGPKNQLYNQYLDRLASFLLSLKGSDNKSIPIVFRPFHELTGNWFWWGKKHCTPEEFKELWKYTFNYLSNKGAHNLIYVYNTADFSNKTEFLERYPGDQYVDIVSFDTYDHKGPDANDTFVKDLDQRLSILTLIAREHNKIPALAETGFEAIPYSEWWTKSLWRGISSHKISYVLAWRNAGYQPATGKQHFYAPYPGQASEQDFIKFFNLDKTLFEEEISKENIYK